MPADLETGMTLGDLLKELSVACNLAEFDDTTGECVIPEDPETKRRLLASVNEGLRNLAAANPVWRRLELVWSLTFSSDGTGPNNIEAAPERYMLPLQVQSRPKGNWYYTDGTSGRRDIIDTSWERIRARFADDPSAAGVPEMACVKSHDPKPGAVRERRRFEAVFWPKPASDFTVEAVFRLAIVPLVDLLDRHPFGADFDQAVLLCSEAAFKSRDEEQADAYARVQKLADRAILQMIELDRQTGVPRTLGIVTDPTVRTSMLNPRAASYQGVTTYNGVSIADTPY